MRFVGTVPASLLVCPQNDRFAFFVGGEIVSSWVARIDWDSLGSAENEATHRGERALRDSPFRERPGLTFFAAINRTFRLRSLS